MDCQYVPTVCPEMGKGEPTWVRGRQCIAQNVSQFGPHILAQCCQRLSLLESPIAEHLIVFSFLVNISIVIINVDHSQIFVLWTISLRDLGIDLFVVFKQIFLKDGEMATLEITGRLKGRTEEQCGGRRAWPSFFLYACDW